MLKPAEQTPLTALRLGELIAEAGVPDGVVNIVTGFGETAGAALAAHPDVDKVAFTGSTEVGKLIVQAAGRQPEEGHPGAGRQEPEHRLRRRRAGRAIEGAANAIFFNHGQCCVAGSRLYVQESMFDKVVDGVAADRQAIKIGPGPGAGHADGPAGIGGAVPAGQRLPASPASSDGATALAGGERGTATAATSSSRRCSPTPGRT